MSNITERENMYKVAPTFLYTMDGDSKLFNSQAEVDKAWDEGWFGPPWAVEGKRAISTMEFDTKAMLGDEVKSDPRYNGLSLNLSRSMKENMDRLIKFEVEAGIIEIESEPGSEDEVEDGDE